MNLIDLAVRRRVTVLMFTVALLLFGAVSLQRLKLDLLPDLSYPTLTVRTELPGAAPLEVENLVTKPVEEAVGIIRNVRHVRSVSRSGQSDVVLEFAWGTDMDLAGIDVREKIDLLQLPLEAKRPLLLRFDPSGEPVIRLALLDTSRDAGAQDRLTYLRRFAEDRLKPDLESVDGSAAVKVSGGYEDEVQVLVDQQKLAQVGLSVDAVARRLKQENVNLSGGRLEQGTQRFLVRTLNEYASVEEMANAILATPEGRPVYLKDVATVTRGHKDREAITRVDGREAIELAVYKEGDANVVQLADGVRARVEALAKALPEGTALKPVYDQSHFIAAAIGEVKESALIGGLLAILVLYCFLRDARMTLISGVAIPVSVVGTFVLMYSADVSLNIMSLGGIALAVGMLVDNAVVVLESIVRRREHGAGRVEAAREGAREVSTAVTAATLTSIAVFFPMVFITGVAGQLFRDQALTVTFSLALSLVVALTLVPMLAAGRDVATASADDAGGDGEARAPGRAVRAASTVVRAARGAVRHVGRACELLLSPLVRGTQAVYSAAERAYPPVVRWALARRATVLGGAFAMFVGTLALVPLLGTELIPQMSQGEFDVDMRLAPGTPLERTDEAVSRAQQAAAGLGNVALAYSVAGTGNRLDANPVDAGENTGKLSLTLAPGARRADEEAAMQQLRASLDRIPGVQYQFSRPGLFTVATPLEVVVSGHDLEQLKAAGESIRARMTADPRFTDVKSTVEAGTPEIQIVFDQERAAQLGLTVRDVADRVVSGVRGEVATRWQWRDKKIDVLVRSVDTRAASIEDVRNLIVNPGAERPVPLSAIADVRLASGPAEIRRSSQERVAIVSANLGTGDLGAAVKALQRIVADTPLPAGLDAYVSGQSEEMTDSFRSLQFVLLLAIFLVYVVMASQFESLLHPLVILLTIPLAVVGAIWALFLTNTTLNVVAYIGVIMLAGIVVNQSIVLIDAVNQSRERGLARTEAIVEAGRARLRPILITKLTTILGLLPMALGLGEGAEVRAPMAITVIGGVLLTTFLTLIVIPVVYAVLDRKVYAGDTSAATEATGATGPTSAQPTVTPAGSPARSAPLAHTPGPAGA
jgi:HAE1 family hydrophobic/amphiphilic exporter-1